VAGAAVRDITISRCRVPPGAAFASFDRPDLRPGVRTRE
jgi:hypothetical protein